MSNENKEIAIDQINYINNKVLQWQNHQDSEDFNSGLAQFILDINKYALRTLNSFNDEKSPNLTAYAESLYKFLKNLTNSTENYMLTEETHRKPSIWNRKNNMRYNLIQSLNNALQVQGDAYLSYFSKENEKVKVSKGDDFSMNSSNNRNFISIPTINDTYSKWNLTLPMEQCKANFFNWLRKSAFVKFLVAISIIGAIAGAIFFIFKNIESEPTVPYFLVDRVYSEVKARGNDLNAVTKNIEAINKNYANDKMPINFKIEGKEIFVTLTKISDDSCKEAIAYREALAPGKQGRTIINNFEILDKAVTPNPFISSLTHPANKVCDVKEQNDVILVLNTEQIYNQNNNLETEPSSFYLEKLKGIIDNYEYIRSYNNTSSARAFFNEHYAPKVVGYLKKLNEQDSAQFVKYMKENTKEEHFREWLAAKSQ